MAEISIDGGCRLGLGVDKALQIAKGEAITFSAPSDAHGGQESESSFKLITSQSELLEALDVSVSAAVRYGMASVDARMEFAQEHSVNEASVYMVLHTVCKNPPQHMVEPELKSGVRDLYFADPDAFHRAFGDHFVDEIYSGGALTVLYMFHTKDESSRTTISAHLQAQIGNFMTGGSITADFSSAVEESKRQSELEMRVFLSGGRGVITPASLQEAIDLYRRFPAAVLDAGVPYRVTIKPWEEFPLQGGPTFAQRVARQDTFEHCGKNVRCLTRSR